MRDAEKVLLLQTQHFELFLDKLDVLIDRTGLIFLFQVNRNGDVLYILKLALYIF